MYRTTRSLNRAESIARSDWGDGFFEDRSNGNRVEYFDVTYTVGRKKDGEAKGAREILMISS